MPRLLIAVQWFFSISNVCRYRNANTNRESHSVIIMDDFWKNTPDLDLPVSGQIQKKRNRIPEDVMWYYMSESDARGAVRTRSRSGTHGTRSDITNARIVAIISSLWR